MCINAYKNLPGIQFLPGERFVQAMHRSGEYINYAVSDYGRVYTFYRHKIMNQYVDDRKYHHLEVRIALNKTAYIGVHYLELMSFQPINNTEIYVPNHKDGNPDNNMLWNLEWMTISENTRHALDTGLANYKGENNSRSIITNSLVHRICELIVMGNSNSDVADIIEYENDLNISRNSLVANIAHMRRGQTYLDIARQYNIKGINGKTDYEPEVTEAICKILSERSIGIEELCNIFNIPLEDRKMFLNYVRDITRRQKYTYIVNRYPILNKVFGLQYNHPDYEWYY